MDIIKDRPTTKGDTDLELLSGIDSYRDKWTTYTHDNTSIPRMSEILKDCIGKDYLISYALKCKNYYYESNQVLYIGTVTHTMIEEFLQYGKVVSDINFGNETVLMQATKAYNNFVQWYKDKIHEGYKLRPVRIEQKVTCPWYGGCIDCIMEIIRPDGRFGTYIVDFKTSNKIAYDYLIQTYGYWWCIEWLARNKPSVKLPRIDGIGIIRVDKKRKAYDDIFFTRGEDDLNLIDIHNGFVSCLNWFYYQKNLEWTTKEKRGDWA